MTGTLKQVLKYINKHRMVNKGDKILLAVSGGPDSVAMLDVLFCLRHDLGISLHIAHLNHMFRGEESLGDAEFVRELAVRYNLPVTVRHINVPSFMEKTGLSSQPAARTVRYSFLDETAAQESASRIALAHHADDQAETVMLHFLRGSGAAGLRGMLPVRDNFYIRPMLCLKRQDIEDYCKKKNLRWRVDSSNLKTDYRRNKIRMYLLPLLEKEYNNNLTATLNRLADIFREEEDYLELMTRNEYNNLTVLKSAGEICLNLKGFQQVPLALQRRILRLAWREITGGFRDLAFEQLGKAVILLTNHVGSGSLEFPRDVKVVKRYDSFSFIIGKDKQDGLSYYYDLPVPGKVYLAEINRTLFCEVADTQAMDEKYDKSFLNRRRFSQDEAWLDYERVAFPLCVRGRQPGDIFEPLGLTGSMKLKKYFINQKVPCEVRDKVPLVIGEGKIIWVGGMQISESVKINEVTTKFLHLFLV
ncbi:tRNA(Ile)-lysidine synthetase [Desulfofarcimen acetoxidans DSM 771]|uniref:tRNA(Ile)-lysidine synthase n=1 Tax=Desulfofarcimen acetoxidans (strain ATCC 49208 / DSM 771 / KCTC 5769 / VKM B-1644 / 5575) TaxID=485916 RepID=C8W3S7_DESAS|nr:tRNA lysidine(34) synthetase TilS [Desulfofarcimen acetoxidans]ACV61181.1 tRNA(Ile)-lysidine synthetase [Desulfofarcimen acetoxidans DSM 771]